MNSFQEKLISPLRRKRKGEISLNKRTKTLTTSGRQLGTKAVVTAEELEHVVGAAEKDAQHGERNKNIRRSTRLN